MKIYKCEFAKSKVNNLIAMFTLKINDFEISGFQAFQNGIRKYIQYPKFYNHSNGKWEDIIKFDSKQKIEIHNLIFNYLDQKV